MKSRQQPSLPARALLLAQRVYKVTLSPLIGQQCRYLPTCSDYAAQCVRAHGAWAGSWMGLARVCRCRPGGGAGYDPPPPVCEAVPWFQPWHYGQWRLPRQESRKYALSSPATAGEVAAKRTEGATLSANTPSGSLCSPAPPLAGEQSSQMQPSKDA